MAQIENLDIELAWKRVKEDIKSGREFFEYAHEVYIVDNTPEFLLSVDPEKFNPSAPLIADIPKGNGALRPAPQLNTLDRILYAACVGAALSNIRSAVSWAQGKVDFAYSLSSKDNDEKWIKSAFGGWSEFRKNSLSALENSKYMVKTDISSFYDSIELSILFYDLNSIGVDKKICDILSKCLNRWAMPSARGVPQGMSASDILAKLYLNSIDNSMSDEGWVYMRYVDDIRIFVNTKAEAKKALVGLTKLLRKRGLVLQSAKTEIMDNESAAHYLNGAIPILEKTKSEYIQSIKEALENDNPYITLSEADVIAIESEERIDETTITQVFDDIFLSNESAFNKSLFHFLLNRLAAYKSQHAVQYCLDIFIDYPQETPAILKYVSACAAHAEAIRFFESTLIKESYVYEHQYYEVFSWLVSENLESAPMLRLAKHIYRDHVRPRYLRAVCRMYVGRFGKTHDIEDIEASYANALDALEQAQILLDLYRMEVGRRNNLLGRAGGDHVFCKTAAKLIKSGYPT